MSEGGAGERGHQRRPLWPQPGGVACRAALGREGKRGAVLFAAVCFPSLTMRASPVPSRREPDTSRSILIANGDGRSIGYSTPSQYAAASAGDNIDRTQPSRPPPFFLFKPRSCSRVSPRNVFSSGIRQREMDISQYTWVGAQYLLLMLRRRPHLFYFIPSLLFPPLLLTSQTGRSVPSTDRPSARAWPVSVTRREKKKKKTSFRGVGGRTAGWRAFGATKRGSGPPRRHC